LEYDIIVELLLLFIHFSYHFIHREVLIEVKDKEKLEKEIIKKLERERKRKGEVKRKGVREREKKR
jgi:hypothetical protein